MERALTPMIRIESDNFDQQLMSSEEYRNYRLEMSTGDFHTHKVKNIFKPSLKDYNDAHKYIDLLHGIASTDEHVDMKRLDDELDRIHAFIKKYSYLTLDMENQS